MLRVRGAHREQVVDCAAVEAPLSIRVQGEPFVLTMRTPGDDRHLAAGFLLSEQVITAPADLVAIVEDTSGDGVEVTLDARSAARLARRRDQRRLVTATAACGICGRPTDEATHTDAPVMPIAWQVPTDAISALPDRLRAAQPVFDQTGGLHAAGLFTRDGRLVAVAEDVGRHNAVDKVIGRQVLAATLPLAEHVLCVSGRASFELVQKAVLAGIPVLVAVSAPSTLAIELAERHGLTLAGFVRGDGFNVYTHPDRIA